MSGFHYTGLYILAPVWRLFRCVLNLPEEGLEFRSCIGRSHSSSQERQDQISCQPLCIPCSALQARLFFMCDSIYLLVNGITSLRCSFQEKVMDYRILSSSIQVTSFLFFTSLQLCLVLWILMLSEKSVQATYQMSQQHKQRQVQT